MSTIKRLAALAETYRTDYDAEDARRLGLGRSAYCYRLVNEAALVRLERGEDQPDRQREQTRERVQRHRERRKAKEGA
jgi:hypothetical protein